MSEFGETSLDIREHCATGEVHLVLGGRRYEPDAESGLLDAIYESMDSFMGFEQ